MPWANQLVMMSSAMSDPNRRSPSVETMEREQDRCLRRCRISSQIMAIGVRDMVEPPMPTVMPS